jgi:hypothetical protein
MKRKIAAVTLCGCLAGGSAGAQAPSTGTPPTSRMPAAPSPSPALSPTPPGAGAGTPAASGGPQTYSAADLPGPTRDEDLRPATIALPDDPLEPYLITKTNGPFMVMAKVFRGPDADRMALALCKELRQDFALPAYILRPKEFPMRSYIRGTPVQAPSETMKSAIKQPEKIRTLDEAAVLVGDEKTLQGSEELLHKVKKLRPKCLEGIPVLFRWREGGGLARAIRTTNPLIPAQWLYPKSPDRLIVEMNKGPRTIANCPGHFTLQVAQYTGRSTFDIYGQGMAPFTKILDPASSPLQSAHDDAERLADRLSKSPEFQRLGQPVYVYHDRTSSRVFVGSFALADDPNAKVIRDELLKIAATATATRDWRGRTLTDQMIVPAAYLTDARELKQTVR